MKRPLEIQDLTEAEALLCKFFENGKPLNLPQELTGGAAQAPPGSARRIIRATVLRRLSLVDSPAQPGILRRVELTGAIIKGEIDLKSAEIRYPLKFTDCVFVNRVLLEGARLRSMTLSGCIAPGIDAQHVVVDGDLAFEHTILLGPLQLAGAHLADDLHLDSACLIAAHGERALDLSNIDVKGKVEANHMYTWGAVTTESADVAKTLRLKHTVIDASRPIEASLARDSDELTAWYGDGMTVRGEVDASGLEADGAVSMKAARVLDLVLRDATIRSSGKALWLDRLDAGGVVCCDGNARFTGGIRAVGIHVGSTMCLRGSSATAGKEDDEPAAVDLSYARIAEALIFEENFSAKGRLDLASAHIGGYVDLCGATMRPVGSIDSLILNANQAEITGNFEADGLTATGDISLIDTTINGSMTLSQRKDGDNPLKVTARGLSVARDVTLDTAGTVDLDSAQIAGDIKLYLSRLKSSGNAAAADLAFARAGVMTLDGNPLQGCVDLTNSRIHLLCDDNFSANAPIVLDGFEYDGIAGIGANPRQDRTGEKTRLRERLDWLKTGTQQVRGRKHGKEGNYIQVGFVQQPYRQLANVYENGGQEQENRAVLRNMYRQQNKIKNTRSLGKLWNNLQDWTVGYGYAPRLALAWLLGLAVVASTVLSFADEARLGLTKTIFLPISLLLPGTAYKDLAPWDTKLGIWSHILAAVLILSGLILGATVLTALGRRIRR